MATIEIEAKHSTNTTYKVYSYRWFILFIFSLGSFINAVCWISFAPITKQSETYLNVGSTAVNMLSMIFMFLYIPGAIISIYLKEASSLRTVVVTGTAGTAICGIGRFLASYLPMTHGSRYGITLLSQSLGALAQPAFMNLPAAVANAWFPRHQRDLATIICSLVNPLGNAMGSLIAGLIVSSNNTNDMRYMLLATGLPAVFAFILAIVFMRSHPPTPPSVSAELRSSQYVQLHKVSNESDSSIHNDELYMDAMQTTLLDDTLHTKISIWQRLKQEQIDLFCNFNFMKLACGFGLGLGLFNGLMTLIDQIVSPCGYSSSDAGLFGAALIVAGMVGAAVAGVILEKFGSYITILRINAMVAIAGILIMLGLLQRGYDGALLGAFAIMGFAMLPLLPITFETAAELTYPIPEDSSGALLVASGQIAGIIVTFALPPLIPDTCGPIFRPSSIFVTVIVLITVILLCLVKPEYRRRQAELNKTVE